MLTVFCGRLDEFAVATTISLSTIGGDIIGYSAALNPLGSGKVEVSSYGNPRHSGSTRG